MTIIDERQLVGKPKKIGNLHGKSVFALCTKGGLNLVATTVDGKVEMIGSGPHPGIARHIAKKKQPDIELTELSKSDWLDPAYFQHLLPKYEELTERLNGKR